MTILFDLDGTLTDSSSGIINCVIPALAHFGISAAREALKVFVGPPLRDSFLKFGVPESDLDEVIEIFRERYFKTGKFENAPYPWMPDVLKTLQAQGHRLFVATSKPQVLADEILERYHLSGYFEKICGATLDDSRVTKSQVISYLKKQCSLGSRMVMVGDTIWDVQGASEHGIPTIAVSWGYGDVEQMRRAGAVIADTPQQLLLFIDQIN